MDTGYLGGGLIRRTLTARTVAAAPAWRWDAADTSLFLHSRGSSVRLFDWDEPVPARPGLRPARRLVRGRSTSNASPSKSAANTWNTARSPWTASKAASRWP